MSEYFPWQVARILHAGQVDKAGRPYFEHVEQVARLLLDQPEYVALSRFEAQHAYEAAWLHDVLEDTSMTDAGLLELNFSQRTVDIVVLLTRMKAVPSVDYYARIRMDLAARAVKLADIASNASPERLALLDESTRNRLIRKYAEAREALL
jgi:(p)ppGpp synthase/HD superfamily hydrolase